MNKKKAKLKFNHNSFEIIEDGDYVLCAVSGKQIHLQDLSYWNVDLQEAYYSPVEVKERMKLNQIKKFISIYYVSISIALDFLQSCFPKYYLTLAIGLTYL